VQEGRGIEGDGYEQRLRDRGNRLGPGEEPNSQGGGDLRGKVEENLKVPTKTTISESLNLTLMSCGKEKADPRLHPERTDNNRGSAMESREKKRKIRGEARKRTKN